MQRLGRVLLVAATSACLVMAGCTTQADPAPAPTPSPSPSASSSAAAPVTLTLGVYGDATMQAAYRKLARVYTKQHPHVTVEVEASPDADAAMAQLDREFSVGDAPDVFVAPVDRVPALSRDDRVRPVDELLEARGLSFGDTYQRLGLEAFSAEQALQCMPFDVSPLVVIYNQGLVPFRRLIEPGDEPLTPETGWKWDQFAKAVRLMSRGGVDGVYVEPRLTTLMALLDSAGHDIVDDPRNATTLTLSDPAARATVEQVLAVLRHPRWTPTAKQLAHMDGITRFKRGKVGMILATRAVVPELRKAKDLDFDVFPLPKLSRSDTVADVTGFCLSAESPRTDAAADFLAFAVGETGSAILARTGEVVPAHLPTLNSPAFAQPGRQPESTSVFNESIAKARSTPFVPGWPQLVTELQPDLRRMFYARTIDLDTLLPRIDATSKQILAPPEESPAG